MKVKDKNRRRMFLIHNHLWTRWLLNIDIIFTRWMMECSKNLKTFSTVLINDLLYYLQTVYCNCSWLYI